MASRVVLIGGAPGVGKTTLARNLADRIGAVPLTADDAQAVVKTVTTPNSHPAMHHERAAGGHVAYFTNTSPERLIADALERERAMWPVVRALIRSHRGRQSPVVIDWWLLPPADVTALDGIESVWIHLEPEALWARERRNVDWSADSTDSERMLANFMARSLWRNELVAVGAERCGLPLIRLTGDESPDDVADRAATHLAAL